MKMSDSSPAWQIKPRDEVANAEILRRLFDGLKAPKRVVEFFGGLGKTTKVIRQMWPQVPIQSWDLDSTCIRFLKKVERCEVIQGDSLSDCVVNPGDGVLMDFNLWTVKRAEGNYADVMKRTFEARPAWVEVADSAMGKMHINFASYGLAKASRIDYIHLVSNWVVQYGYRLGRYEVNHVRTMTFLFVPSAQKKTAGV